MHLGSLDFLQNHITGYGFTSASKKKGIREEVEEFTSRQKFDIVIMNPPFSRSAKPNVRYGYKEKDVQQLMKEKEKELLQLYDLRGAGKAGIGALFIVLGDVLLKNEGRMGVVIPRAFLSGVSWSKIRRMLLDNYEILYIISNFDPGDKGRRVEPWNWSEDTDLGEIMFVAQKTTKPFSDRYVTYVNFHKKPASDVESLFATFDILKKKPTLQHTLDQGVWEEIRLGDQIVGTLYKVKQDDLKHLPNFQTPCLFANPELNRFILNLHKDKNLQDLLVPLPNITANQGVDIAQVKNHFAESSLPTNYKIVRGQQKDMNTMLINKIGYGRAKTPRADRVYKRYKGDVLLSERPHLNNDALICFESSYPVLATAMWELRLQSNVPKELFVLWMNSTIGLLLYLSCATNSMGEIFKFKKEHMNGLKVLSPSILSPEEVSAGIDLYKKIRNQPFAPFPEEFSQAIEGKGLRKQIDDFFIRVLGDRNVKMDLSDVYEMLATEPIFTLKRLPFG